MGRGARLLRCLCACVALTAVASGCHTTPSEALLTKVPEQGVCKVTAVQTSPWIVTLPADNSVDLDTRLTDPDGLVPVRYRGCEMEVLTRCKIAGSYRWKSANLAANSLVIENADELYAKMPIGAMSIEGHFARGEALRVSYTLSGRFSADRPTASYEELQALGGDCATATHLVVGALGGAYDFESVAKASVGGNAGTFAKGDSSAKRSILNSRGKQDACAAGASGETAPPHNCGAPLKIELAEVTCPATMHFVQEKGCVGGIGADGGGRPVIVNAPAPVLSFATAVFGITRVILNAARGKPVPPGSTTSDFLENRDELVKKFGELTNAGLVLSHARLELRNAGGTRINAQAFVWPDGRTKWMSFEAGEVDDTELPAVAGLDQVKDLLARELVGGSCSLDLVTTSDFDALPIPDDQREKVGRKLAGVPEELAEACAKLKGASGPWQIALTKVEVFLSTEHGLGVIKADLSWDEGKPKIGWIALSLM